jgi:hypothetical protein
VAAVPPGVMVICPFEITTNKSNKLLRITFLNTGRIGFGFSKETNFYLKVA